MSLIRDSIVGYWKGDENTGTTVADATGGGSTMTFNSSNFGSGIINSGMSCDNTHSLSGTLNGAPLGATARTVSVWVLFGSIGNDTIMGWGTANTGQGFMLQVNTGTQFHFSGWNDDANWVTNFQNSVWYNIVLTYDGNTSVQLYINNVDFGAQTISTQLNTTGSTLKFGIAINGGGSPQGLSVDEIGIWTRILTPSEIERLYNKGQALPYPFINPYKPNALRPRAFAPGIAR